MAVLGRTFVSSKLGHRNLPIGLSVSGRMASGSPKRRWPSGPAVISHHGGAFVFGNAETPPEAALNADRPALCIGRPMSVTRFMSQMSMKPILEGRSDVVLTNQATANVGAGLRVLLLVGDGRPQRIRIDRATVHVADQNLTPRGPRQLIEELERVHRGGGDDGQRSGFDLIRQFVASRPKARCAGKTRQ